MTSPVVPDAAAVERETDPILADPVGAPWLAHLSWFGPPTSGPVDAPTAFAGPGPETPTWLARLQDESVNPTEILDPWRPDLVLQFTPLYSETSKWQRLWHNGAGCPHRGFFVRVGLLFKTGFYSDRLCLPTLSWQDNVADIKPQRAFRSDPTGAECSRTVSFCPM